MRVYIHTCIYYKDKLIYIYLYTYIYIHIYIYKHISYICIYIMYMFTQCELYWNFYMNWGIHVHLPSFCWVK